jgi:hypothetical protein
MIDQSWYDAMLIVMEDAPEILHEMCQQKADELNVPLEYFMLEFVQVV